MGAGLTSRSRAVLAAHRLALRAAGTPLGRAWAPMCRGLARIVTEYVSGGRRDAARYVRGGLATGDFVPAISDVDTTVVVGGRAGAATRARRRWQRLSRALPLLTLVVDGPLVYDELELGELARASALTVGLAGAGGHRTAYFGAHANFDWLRTLERPGLYGPTAGWRRLAGPDRRLPAPVRGPQERRIAAWLELVYLWRWAFPLTVDASGPRAAAMCVKLVAEPVRIWLWLARGERAEGREDALRRGLRELPEEESALRRALDLHREFARAPEPPLAMVLPAAVRMSARIAALIAAELTEEDATEVRLAGDDLVLPAGGPEASPLPLADWRALACPALPDESFVPLAGDPGDPAVLAAAVSAQGAGPYPALRAGGVTFLPAGPWWRTRLRAVQCQATDPVSFALAEGEPVASFPGVRGWSAEDTARRAVAEHRAWLAGEPAGRAVRAPSGSGGHELGRLLTGARAALFLESVREGEPELAVTVAEAARRIGERSPAARAVAEEAMGRYREFARDRTAPPPSTVSATRRLVASLPAYGEPDRRVAVTPRSAR